MALQVLRVNVPVATWPVAWPVANPSNDLHGSASKVGLTEDKCTRQTTNGFKGHTAQVCSLTISKYLTTNSNTFRAYQRQKTAGQRVVRQAGACFPQAPRLKLPWSFWTSSVVLWGRWIPYRNALQTHSSPEGETLSTQKRARNPTLRGLSFTIVHKLCIPLCARD